MPIIIEKVDGGYKAKVEHKHQKIFWESDKPYSAKILVKKLLSLGCHQIDIADAFKEINSNWLEEVGG